MNELVRKLQYREPLLWINQNYSLDKAERSSFMGMESVYQAEGVLEDYAPVLQKLFPELEPVKGIIESPLLTIDAIYNDIIPPGHLLLKADHLLPVSGSIKARGGIFAVLKIVDHIAERENIFRKDRRFTLSGAAKKIFSNYRIAVGSTGNLGLSIGIAGRAFGFSVEVHMSSAAKRWKKELLDKIGADVIAYDSDYTAACEAARVSAQKDDSVYFIDDENSTDLFLGYSVAALRLKKQLNDLNIMISEKHPLFVYLPCGVGGAPGGITFALKQLFGNSVHCFFAEPVDAPAMILGLITGKHDGISIQDIGLSGNTSADGLAVGRPSGFVSSLMKRYLDGAYTLPDRDLFFYLARLYDTEGFKVEPSAAAGFAGPVLLTTAGGGRSYMEQKGIEAKNIIHLIWSTGGSMEPRAEFQKNYKKHYSQVCMESG